ncbi:MAG: hypothetical protein JWL73_2013 [Actinomycetia bacterium]|nr:hypothetical protein [Actinomycetes bacterium]
MRVPDAALDAVRQRGFVVVPGFLAAEELAAAQRALWLHYPSPDAYFADPAGHPEYSTSGFAGVLEFPYRSWDLNRLTFHPDLVDAAERYLSTPDLQLYKIELWAKYAGAWKYDQPLHRDYGSHSLVVPRVDGRYQQLTSFIYLSDVSEADGPTRLVPLEHSERVPFTPLYFEPGALDDVAVPAVGPAGSLLMYRTDILHRASNFSAPGRARFSLLVDYQARGTTWGGKMSWPKDSPELWAELLPRCTVRERDLFGFPRPGHEYWNAQTLADVAARYPGMDMAPYRESAGVDIDGPAA